MRKPVRKRGGGSFFAGRLPCLASGLLCALPLLWENLFWLSWIALLPMAARFMLHTPRWREAFWFGIGYYGVLYHWFTCLYPMDFAGFSAAQSIGAVAVCWIGLTLLQTVGTAFLAPLFRMCRHLPHWSWPLSFAACWTALEWCQTQTWLGVPYFRLALSQSACLPMLQSAALLGSLFTGFLIAAVNGLLALALVSGREHAGALPVCAALTGALILTGANYGYGVHALSAYRDEGEPVRITAVQANISSTEKWKSGTAISLLNAYAELSEAAAAEENPPVLLFWPETALNANVRGSVAYRKALREVGQRCGIPILFGAFDKLYGAEGEVRIYNALLLLDEDGSLSEQVYYKRRLVPFGEFLPMKKLVTALLPVLADMNLLGDDLTPGDSPALIDTAYGKIGGLICFDSIYETLTLDSVRAGAQLLALATNDSWYQDSAAVYQHNRHAVLRAVESGRYIVRAANTGISSIIRPTGEITASLAPLKAGVVTGDVYFRSDRTVYSIVGNVIVLFCGAWLLCGAAGAIRARYRKKRRP